MRGNAQKRTRAFIKRTRAFKMLFICRSAKTYSGISESGSLPYPVPCR